MSTKPEWIEEDRGYETPCWIWQRARNNRGYGRRRVRGREILAHRHAYESEHGPIPAGLVIDHLCKQEACVRVAHMEAVTQAVNVQRGSHVIHAERVVEIRRRFADGEKSFAAIGRSVGLDRSTTRKIALGLSWK